MSTALTLPDDLVAALRARAEAERRPVEAVHADAVRRGLAAGAGEPARGEASSVAWPTLPWRIAEPRPTAAYTIYLARQLEHEDDRRRAGLLTDHVEDATQATEDELRRLEEQIPALIGPAFEHVFEEALAAGSTVLIREDDALVEVAPDGTRRVIRPLPPMIPVAPAPPRER